MSADNFNKPKLMESPGPRLRKFIPLKFVRGNHPAGSRQQARLLREAHAMAKRVKSGVVWINCFNEFDDAAPFGGYKESGWGRDLSAHALENYTQLKTVWTHLPEV